MTLSDLVTGIRPDYRRDRWGRPLIMQADGTRKPYTRASSATKAIDDEYNLVRWQLRNVAYGMAHDASLVARTLAVGGNPASWTKGEKIAIHDIIDAANTCAQAHKGADIGTAVHRIIERLNRGETVDPGPYQADVDAYYQALDAAGLEILPDYLEVHLVCDELEVAGCADNIVATGDHRKRHIADLKTGATVEWGALSHAGQLACYARGTIYDVEAERRLDTPPICPTVGFIIHLPAGQGVCTIYELDLIAGWEAAQTARTARRFQKESKTWLKPLSSIPPPAPIDLDMVKQRALALKEAGHGQRLAYAWPDGIPGFKDGHHHNSLELSAILVAVRQVEDEMSMPFHEADTPAPHPTVDGIRTHHTTGGKTTQRLAYEIREPDHRPGEQWLHIIGGPTGYESAPLLDLINDLAADPKLEGWSACAGTAGRWDSLLITRDSLLREFQPAAPRSIPTSPVPIDEGPDIDDDLYGHLQIRFNELPLADRERLGEITAQATAALVPIKLNDGTPSVRRFEIARALILWCEAGWDAVAISEVLEAIVDYDIAHDTPLGAVIGTLTIDEAKRFADMAQGALDGAVA